MTKLKNSNWVKSKNSNCDKTQNSNCNKTLKKNWCDKTRIATKLKNRKCGKSQKLKEQQNFIL